MSPDMSCYEKVTATCHAERREVSRPGVAHPGCFAPAQHDMAGCSLLRQLFALDEVVDGGGEFGEVVDDVVGLNFAMGVLRPGREEDGFDAQLLRAENIVVQIVADEKDLLRLKVQRVEGLLEDAPVRFAKAIIA